MFDPEWLEEWACIDDEMGPEIRQVADRIMSRLIDADVPPAMLSASRSFVCFQWEHLFLTYFANGEGHMSFFDPTKPPLTSPTIVCFDSERRGAMAVIRQLRTRCY